MIEKIGNNEVIVRDYTSNFNIKEYIQDVLIPKAFPNIPMNKLNLGFTGIVSEIVSQAIEDTQATSSLMLNEAFPTRSILASSIYNHASLFNIGYAYAVPSRCNFALQLWIPDIIQYSAQVRNTQTYRYYLDKNTKIMLGNNNYKLDYDIIIDHQFIGGKRVFSVYYDMSENNSVSIVSNKYVKYQVSSIDWLVLFVELQEFDRKVETNSITDNLVTVNSDIKLKWNNQIAGVDLMYITPQGERLPMKLKTQHTSADVDPFVWYRFEDDNTMILSFSNNEGFFVPSFNSKIESTIYTCHGLSANFDSYDRKSGIPVQKIGERFSYNANTRMIALCYSGSVGGLDRGDIELLREDTILAYNTANALTTDNDLQMWFNRNAKRNGTRAEFFKRRDDPTGSLFSQFIVISDNTYVYPTNTLGIEIDQNEFDFVNNDQDGNASEFIIKPGHLWEYNDSEDSISRNKLRMIHGVDSPAMITDDILPELNESRRFMFTNPFYIKIHRDPVILANYNCLINHTSWPEDIKIDTDSFYQFQLATLSIERSMSKKFNNKYKIQVICVPVIASDTDMKYVEGVTDDFPIYNNNLRLVMVTRSSTYGETGYIEMKPVELRNGGSILFETELSIHDNLQSNMMLEVDLDNTSGIHSLITTGPNEGKVFIDAKETSFHFICMMKDMYDEPRVKLFDDDSFSGYVMTNRFANAHRDLTLFSPLNMMRSVVEFSGKKNNYHISASLVPFLKYDVPLNDDKMLYFIRAFNEQYESMKPALNKLDGNSFIDFKLFNTYGRSSNYFIGPKDGEDVLWNSDIMLDNVYVKIKLRIAVYDRSLYTQTIEGINNDIKSFFDDLDSGKRTDVHASDLIHMIKENQPNVSYIRFIGFNDYDANKQSIFTKYDDVSAMNRELVQNYVPEMIRVDSDSIEIIEEV